MTSRVADLLAELSRRGITLRPAGPHLGVSPRSALTPDLLARIREHKAEILSTLAAPPPPHRFIFPLGATPAERAALLAIAVRPGIRFHELTAATHLCRAVLDDALATLRDRREITHDAAGGYHLVVH